MENYPALFIFLIDQSYSMEGNPIDLVSQALKLFLQSLPEGSYYQLVGFGSDYIKYDKQPKKYIKENITKSMELIDRLNASLGGTDVYSSLEIKYTSYKIYDEINLPKIIFLLTDGAVDDKKKVIELIQQNNERLKIYSFGNGEDFDQDLIRN